MKNEIIHERNNGEKNAIAYAAREKNAQDGQGHNLGQLVSKGSANGRSRKTKDGQK